MNNLATILSPERILIDSNASSKKRILEQLSALCAPSEETETFYQALINRERLGSTGLGDGVAIPHCRIPFLMHPTAGFIRLTQGIDYDAPDQQPVFLIFGLFVPEEASSEHLELLAQLATIFSNPLLREKIKQAQTTAEIYTIFKTSL